MNRKPRSAAAAAFLFVLLAGALLLVSREPPPRSLPRPEAALAPEILPGAAAPIDATLPEELAALFGYPARAAHRSPARPTARTEDRARASRGTSCARPAAQSGVSPLRYVGWASRGDGGRWYLFADTETGRVLELSPGRGSDRWTLVKRVENRFVLSDGSADYVVEGR